MTSSHATLDRLDDDAVRRATLDPHDMLGLVRRFPEQCHQAVEIGRRLVAGAPCPEQVSSVIITGMGGSAIGGDYARLLAESYGRVAITVNRDYTLPSYTDARTLVIAASYSGNTEETLSAYSDARKAGAPRMAVTSGGTIFDWATEDAAPVARVPGGQAPRSALGYMFFPILVYLEHCGILQHSFAADIDETLSLLQTMRAQLGPDIPTRENPAKQLALELQGKIPIIYGSQGYRGAVAVRWKGQINENSKQAAFANVFPEQNHNEIVGWTLAPKQAPNWTVVYLRDRSETVDSPRIARRIEVTREIIGDVPSHEVWAEGESLLARMFSLTTFVDYVTVYLAYLNGVCPTDIAGINRLKAELSRLA
jgi:glucose/mannose-6-phosphate isomerase